MRTLAVVLGRAVAVAAEVAAAAVILSALFASPARAQSSVPEFMANGAARRATIKACRDDAALHMHARTAARCANAELAETRLYSERARRGLGVLDDPEHWRTNPGMVAALRTACARRADYDAALIRYCHHLPRIS